MRITQERMREAELRGPSPVYNKGIHANAQDLGLGGLELGKRQLEGRTSDVQAPPKALVKKYTTTNIWPR
jgi:hypothetical protein